MGSEIESGIEGERGDRARETSRFYGHCSLLEVVGGGAFSASAIVETNASPLGSAPREYVL